MKVGKQVVGCALSQTAGWGKPLCFNPLLRFVTNKVNHRKYSLRVHLRTSHSKRPACFHQMFSFSLTALSELQVLSAPHSQLPILPLIGYALSSKMGREVWVAPLPSLSMLWFSLDFCRKKEAPLPAIHQSPSSSMGQMISAPSSAWETLVQQAYYKCPPSPVCHFEVISSFWLGYERLVFLQTWFPSHFSPDSWLLNILVNDKVQYSFSSTLLWAGTCLSMDQEICMSAKVYSILKELEEWLTDLVEVIFVVIALEMFVP